MVEIRIFHGYGQGEAQFSFSLIYYFEKMFRQRYNTKECAATAVAET